MYSGSFWVTCLFPEPLGLLEGSKVHLSQCLACPVEGCPHKNEVFQAYLPEQVDLGRSSLNRKLMDLNEKLDAAKKKADLYCPRKATLTTKCIGLTSFCRLNLICGRFKERTGRLFIRSFRWRKAMMYVVKFRNGEVRQIEKSELATVNIDLVEVVYPGTLEVEVVTELVPQGEEQERLSDTVASFREKYNGKVVCEKGMVSFEEWFTKAATGDRAIIPERALVPVKTYRVVKLKGSDKVKLPVQSPVPAEIAPPQKPAPAPVPPKPSPVVPAPTPKPVPVAPKPIPVPPKPAAPAPTQPKSAPKPVGRPPKSDKLEKVEKPEKKPAPPPPKKIEKPVKKPVQAKLFTPPPPARREPAKRGRKPGGKKK
jgi:hypothetical protein